MWRNFQLYQKNVPHKILIPVIKANAYGHGAKEVLTFLYEKGITFFAVSLLEEALELKAVIKNIDILIMGAVLEDQFPLVSKHQLTMTLYDEDICYKALKSHLPLKCHIKIDTGMSRYGLRDQTQSVEVIETLMEAKHIDLEGVYTHFATADDDEVFYLKQMHRFKSFVEKLKKRPRIIHASNSSSIAKYENQMLFTTHARIGISLYGLSLDHLIKDIKPVMTLKTKIVQVKHLKPREYVGYGITYCATEETYVGLIPIGYADGFLRRNKHGDVLIHGKKYPLIGNICMDTSFIKIDSSIKKGDEVILFGSQALHTDIVAKRNESIHYEIVTSISYRVPRIYIKEGKMYD